MRRCPKPRPKYRCITHSYTNDYACTGHGIDETDIFGTILESIRLYARLAVRLSEINAVRQERCKRKKRDLGKQIIALQNEKLRLDSRLQELYEGFVGGELSREKYLLQKNAVTEREQEIAAGTTTLERSMAESSAVQSEAIARYIGYSEIDELTVEILDDLVSRVNVYPDNVLEVQLNFTDDLEQLRAEMEIDA